MEPFITASFRAFSSLFAPGMFTVFFLCVTATILSLTGFVIVSGALFSWLGAHLAGTFLLPLFGTLGAMLIAWLLFPGIMPVIVTFFDERIVTLIERDDYPNLPPAIATNMAQDLWHNIRFSALIIGLNIIALPFYLIPLVNILLFFGLNGYLLGREFFGMVAHRHLSLPESEKLRKAHSRAITTAGVMLAILATVPLLNLFAPFWGIALMVHLYHRFNPAAA